MKTEKAMLLALEQASISFSKGEIPIGAIVLHRGSVIAAAHNECEQRKDATAHAEMLAMKKASEYLSDWRLNNCTLVVTLEPCSMCAGAMINAQLGRLIYGAFDPKAGACGSVVNILDGLMGHRVHQVGGILEDDCQNMLKCFFQKLR